MLQNTRIVEDYIPARSSPLNDLIRPKKVVGIDGGGGAGNEDLRRNLRELSISEPMEKFRNYRVVRSSGSIDPAKESENEGGLTPPSDHFIKGRSPLSHSTLFDEIVSSSWPVFPMATVSAKVVFLISALCFILL